PSAGESKDRRARFLQEARAASSLNHPNIITIYDVVSVGSGDCLVVEFVRGQTIGDMLTGGSPDALELGESDSTVSISAPGAMAGSPRTMEGAIIGTLSYMSPE